MMKSHLFLLILIFALSASLSAQDRQPANCYIAAPGATLEFNARLQGCSTDTIEGTPASAEVIWESRGASVKVKEKDVVSAISFSEETGLITLTAASSGNALVAVTDEVGNILWSWHIWVTPYNPERGCYVQNEKGAVMMDRNLGALSDEPGNPLSLGLFYQWGRKDPFPGPADIEGKREAANTFKWSRPVNSDNYTGTLEYTRFNPTTFILWSDDNCDWFFTGEVRSDNTRWAREKTKYDPCPAGWKVPEAGNVLGADPKWSSAARGMVSTDLADPSHKVWTPAAGFRSGIDGVIGGVGLYGYYWSSAPINCLARSQYFDGEGTISNNFGAYRGTARQVRCVKE